MSLCYKVNAPKKAVNLSLNSELLKLGKDLGLNLSSLAEAALAEAVQACLERDWLLANQEAIEQYNEHVARQGVFSDAFRRF